MDAIEAWLYGLTTLEVIGLTGVFVLVLILYLVQRVHNFLVEIMYALRRIERRRQDDAKPRGRLPP